MEHTQIKPSETARTISRMRSSTAQIIFLIAPAGYGKSTLASAIRADYEHAALCDCTTIVSRAHFVRAVLEALVVENPEKSAFYSELQMRARLTDNEQELTSILDAAWHVSLRQSLFVFENAEAVAHNGPVAALLTRLLQNVPKARRIIICSRVPLPTRAGRYLEPHRMLTIGATELALSDDEATELLQSQGVRAEDIPKAIEISKGWPIMLLLLAQLSCEGRLHEVTERWEPLLDELLPYLLYEVVEPLDALTARALAICAMVPRLTITELTQALDQPTWSIQSMFRTAPLVYRDGDYWVVHELMKQALLQRVLDWKSSVYKLAALAEQRAQYDRACELYRIAGSEASAVRVLEHLCVDELMSPRYARELASMTSATKRMHPKLALAIFNQIGFTPELRTELIEIFNTLSDNEDPALVANLARAIVSANWWFGDVEGIRRIFADERLQRALSSGSKVAQEAFLGVEDCFYAGLGVVEPTIDPMKRAYAESLRATLPHPRTLLARKIAASERWRGEKTSSIEWFEKAVRHAHGSGSALLYSSLLVDALMNAWFWGEDSLFVQYESQLETWTRQSGFAEHFASFHAALRGNGDFSHVPLPKPNIVFGELIAASNSKGESREMHLRQAERSAEETEEAPLIAVCAVARAAAQPHRRNDLLTQAARRLDETNLPTLRAAIQAYERGKPSFLDTFVRRYETVAATAPSARTDVEVQILFERVRLGEEFIKLSAREAALIAYLCRQRSAVAREQIQDALWPELDETGARDSLYSLLYRMRKRSKNNAIVENCGNAYRIAGDVEVDIWSFQPLARDIERGKDVPVDQVQTCLSTIHQRSYPHLLQVEWFGTIDYQIRETGRLFARYLIEDALRRAEYQRALDYAQALLQEDETDDWAHETMIRVSIETGDTAVAQRLYRRYCAILQKSIEAAPAPEVDLLMRRNGLLTKAS